MRVNFLYCFIGTNRTGKSSIAKAMGKAWKSNNPGRLIVAHDPQDNFEDLADLFIQPEDDDWALKCCEFRNCLIILDDFRLINEGNRPVKGLTKLLYYRAKWNIDIIVISHNPGLVINALTHFISHYFIFLTNAQEGAFKNKIPNYSLCVAASDAVNKYVSLFGRGSWPKFPFIIVDSEKQKLIALNMEKTLTKVIEKDIKIENSGQKQISDSTPKRLNSGNNNNINKS